MCKKHLRDKFDTSSSQFLAQQQLAGQSCCTVLVTCRDSFCPGMLHARNFTSQKTGTRLTDTRASFLYKTTCTSFWYKFLERLSPALEALLLNVIN